MAKPAWMAVHKKINNWILAVDNPWGDSSCPLLPGRIGIWNDGISLREENWKTQRKPLGARTRTNNELNPHVMPGPRFEPSSQ